GKQEGRVALQSLIRGLDEEGEGPPLTHQCPFMVQSYLCIRGGQVRRYDVCTSSAVKGLILIMYALNVNIIYIINTFKCIYYDVNSYLRTCIITSVHIKDAQICIISCT